MKPVADGYERQWVRCKTCKRIAYYDYVPYSLSTPIHVMPCGHGATQRFEHAVDFIPPPETEHERPGYPMSDPIKAAAERARQRRAGEHLATDEAWHDPTSPDVDNAVLADAYLAANPADEDEPITRPHRNGEQAVSDIIDFLICRAEICESADVSCLPEAKGLREAAAEISRLRTALAEAERDAARLKTSVERLRTYLGQWFTSPAMDEVEVGTYPGVRYE